MGIKMSISTRKEILINVKKRYKQANKQEKCKILDELVLLTGYRRKYAINLLNCNEEEKVAAYISKKQPKKKKYNESVRLALLSIWNATNQICSKRLVPFIPDLLTTLERFGHLSLSDEVRNLVLSVSPATVDRILRAERLEAKKGLSTTRPGSLLKKQIKIRTFADWNDVIPGFLEGDLVAHCGGRTNGSFLNSLVVTDISSTWTEFFPLLRKSEGDVINALLVAKRLLPFPLLGLDTDNGSEFINYGLLAFCKNHEITFTRSRAYKKNDQAHVEEKNGSIIRRIVGYDRYEGLDAYNALSKLYAVLRLYINFFQPSLKLLSKTRDGAKVTKKYDKAKTPYQRLMLSSHISEESKENLRMQYELLDPVALLQELGDLQNNFWKYAWNDKMNDTVDNITNKISDQKTENFKENNNAKISNRLYRHTKKPRKKMAPRTWRTTPDPFAEVWEKTVLRLELDPKITAKALLEDLIKENVGQFSMKQLRTIQRRVAGWRLQQIKLNQEKNCKETLTEENSVNEYISLVAHSIINKADWDESDKKFADNH